MEVSSDQIRGAQAHLNWQFILLLYRTVCFMNRASTSETANPTPLIYSELKTDFIKDKTKRGVRTPPVNAPHYIALQVSAKLQ